MFPNHQHTPHYSVHRLLSARIWGFYSTLTISILQHCDRIASISRYLWGNAMYEQSWVYEGTETALISRSTTEKRRLYFEMMIYSSL